LEEDAVVVVVVVFVELLLEVGIVCHNWIDIDDRIVFNFQSYTFIVPSIHPNSIDVSDTGIIFEEIKTLPPPPPPPPKDEDGISATTTNCCCGWFVFTMMILF
jgi:hypothetical protein